MDPSRLFWPYALIVAAILILAVMVAAQLFAQSTVTTLSAETASLSSVVSAIIAFYLGWLVAAVSLLGAAIARRLRDANRSPVWGILPAIAAVANALFISAAFRNDDIMNPRFFGDFLANLVTAVLLIVLVVNSMPRRPLMKILLGVKTALHPGQRPRLE